MSVTPTPTHHRAYTAAHRDRRAVVGVLLAAVASWWLPLLVAGSHVVPQWLWPALLSLVALVVAWSARSLRLVSGLVAVPMLLLCGFQAMTTHAQVLATDPATGCRVVGTESSFLMGAGGWLGATSERIGLVVQQSRYSADDGERPLSGHEYSVIWGRGPTGAEMATVTLEGDQPIWPTLHELRC